MILERPTLWVVTGISGSGKTTVGRLLADRLDPSAFVEGDALRTMVRSGRVDMRPRADPAAEAQLRLRYEQAALLASSFVANGFHTVVEDVMLGSWLTRFLELLEVRPLHLVVLAPSVEAVAEREAARGKDGYANWTVAELDRGLREETPRLGLWLDTTALTAEETADGILRRGSESLLRA